MSNKISNLKYINRCKNIGKASWQIIKSNKGVRAPVSISEIRVGATVEKNPQNICNLFNDYFIDLVELKSSKNLNFESKKSEVNSIFISPITTDEIKKIIMSLKNTNAVGVDNIATKILKSCADYLIKPFAFLINICIEQGHFPEELKISLVKPLYKKGEKYNLNNYRPITLIPTLAKVFEKIICQRLTDYVEKRNLLKPEQNGFRRNKSTTLAAYHLMKLITESLEVKIPTCTIFMDMSKAFDFVSHEILLKKLYNFGIRGNAYDLMKSYLSKRVQQTVTCKICPKTSLLVEYRSVLRENKFGVPQGSILGPLLFILYINDLPDVTKNPMILFADDSVAVVRGNDGQIEEKANDSLKLLGRWMVNNNLTLNICKTKYIQFHTPQSTVSALNIHYNNETVEQVNEISFLGITLDQHCNWKSHCASLCSKLNRYIYVLRRIVNVSSFKTGLMAYHGYVSSNLRYGLILWGNSCEVQSVFIAQKKCIRALCKVNDQTHSCVPLFKQTKILPLCCLYIYEVCIFVKTHADYFTEMSDNYSQRLREHNKHKLVVPKFRLTSNMNSIFAMSVKIFNCLPLDIRQLTINKLKKRLYNWLLEKCFYDIRELVPPTCV